jgi:glycosyltransferase involved in cell wall biosynthesis
MNTEQGPLVSVIIPTYNRPELLLTRSLPSALEQTYPNLDIHIVGDGCPGWVEQAITTGLPADPRVRFTNIERQNYPDNSYFAWCVRGSKAINYGLDTAQGEWVTTLGDDDQLVPNCLDTLLDIASAQDVDLVYGRSEIVGHGFLGDGNPRLAAQTNHALWKLDDERMDLVCYQRGLPNDWDLLSRLLVTHRWAFIPVVVHRYFPTEHVPDSDPT